MNNEKKTDSKIKLLIPILLIIIMIISFIGYFVVRAIKRHEVSGKSVISYLQKKYKDDEFSDVKLIDKKAYNYMAKCDGAENGRTCEGPYNNEFIQLYSVYSKKLGIEVLVQHYETVPTCFSWVPLNNMKDNYNALNQSMDYQTIIERYLGEYDDVEIESKLTTNGASETIRYTYKKNKNFNENEYDILAFIDKQTKDYEKINQINNDVVGSVTYYVEYNDITFIYNPHKEYSTNEQPPRFYCYSNDNKIIYLDDEDFWNKINTLRYNKI